MNFLVNQAEEASTPKTSSIRPVILIRMDGQTKPWLLASRPIALAQRGAVKENLLSHPVANTLTGYVDGRLEMDAVVDNPDLDRTTVIVEDR